VRGESSVVQKEVDAVEESLGEFRAQLARVKELMEDVHDTPKKKRRLSFW
jgi:hypothetical protein